MNRASTDSQNLDEAYAALDLRPGADLAQVKAAYRRLARALHPDLNPHSSGALMAQANQAYRSLLAHLAGQETPRSPLFQPYVYEEFTAQPVAGQPGGGQTRPAASSQAQSPLGGFSYVPPQERAWAGPDLAAPSGAPSAPGPSWRLTGLETLGLGLLYHVELCGRPASLELPVRRQQTCPACLGRGRLESARGGGPCPDCGGKGHITRSQMVRVDLPDGWSDGQRLSVPVRGQESNIHLELRRAPRERL